MITVRRRKRVSDRSSVSQKLQHRKFLNYCWSIFKFSRSIYISYVILARNSLIIILIQLFCYNLDVIVLFQCNYFIVLNVLIRSNFLSQFVLRIQFQFSFWYRSRERNSKNSVQTSLTKLFRDFQFMNRKIMWRSLKCF